MRLKQFSVLLSAAIAILAFSSLSIASHGTPGPDEASGRLVGVWQIDMIKEPGKSYQKSYKGRPLVAKGPHAFTVIVEFRKDGSFKRMMRVGHKETVQTGKWTLHGHELRQTRNGNLPDEVMYIRFDGPNEFTSIEVYEKCSDPGTFARYKRASP